MKRTECCRYLRRGVCVNRYPNATMAEYGSIQGKDVIVKEIYNCLRAGMSSFVCSKFLASEKDRTTSACCPFTRRALDRVMRFMPFVPIKIRRSETEKSAPTSSVKTQTHARTHAHTHAHTSDSHAVGSNRWPTRNCTHVPALMPPRRWPPQQQQHTTSLLPCRRDVDGAERHHDYSFDALPLRLCVQPAKERALSGEARNWALTPEGTAWL